MDFMNPESVLSLENIRNSLVRMEDTIVFNLIERAQFFAMPSVYDAKALLIPNFEGSFLEWILIETEKMNSKVRRYEAPDEVAFYPQYLEKPILPVLKYPPVLASYHKEVNEGQTILEYYINTITKLVSQPGEQPENVGSCALCDVECLQAISRRVHFGKFVAEAKFRSEKERFTKLILAKDVKGIEEAITNQAVEDKILERLSLKADTYGIDPTLRWSQKAQGQIKPEAVVSIYKEFIIPLTKKVEVDYLLRRLEEE